jgi:protein phosphatase
VAVPRIDAYGSAAARVEDEPCDPTLAHVRLIPCDPDATTDTRTTSSALVALQSSARTDIGKVKPSNQDNFLVQEDKGLFVVADGIGGYAGGEIASATAVEVLGKCFANGAIDVGRLSALPKSAGELASAVYAANTAIRRKAAADWNFADMGTTCVAARLDLGQSRMYIAHIGDSRAYRLRGGAFTQMTTDHTMENMGMVGARASHLASALGAEPCPKIDMLVASLQALDVYLLCSDGLNKMVADERLAEVLGSSRSAEDAATRLVALANEAGGKDNVTALVVRVL